MNFQSIRTDKVSKTNWSKIEFEREASSAETILTLPVKFSFQILFLINEIEN